MSGKGQLWSARVGKESTRKKPKHLAPRVRGRDELWSPPPQIRQKCKEEWSRWYKMERERSREKYPMTNKSHSLLLFSSQTASFFLAIFQHDLSSNEPGSWDSWLTADKPEGEHPCEKHQTPVSNHPSLPGEGAPCQPLQWRWITLHQGCLSQLGYQKQDGCILKSSSSAGLTQRGFSLCICMYTQMQTTLKWWGVHTKTVLEAAQQQPCALPHMDPTALPTSVELTDGGMEPLSCIMVGRRRVETLLERCQRRAVLCLGPVEVSGCLGKITKSELGHDVQ